MYTDHSETRPKEACGIVGVFGMENAAASVCRGLFHLQHRGDLSTGIASVDRGKWHRHRDMGRVTEVFTAEVVERLPGHMAIGHNRYATTGSAGIENAQPLYAERQEGSLALGHNGNLTNSESLRRKLEAQGVTFYTTTDSEIMMNLIVRQLATGANLEKAILYMMTKVEGAYSLIIQTEDTLVGVRDPHGIRPLCLGKRDGAWALASETCALDHMGFAFARYIEPGEIVMISSEGVDSMVFPVQATHAFCIFEYVYFARPDSQLGNGRTVYETRVAMGMRLAREYPIAADIVVPIPDSGICAALGYSNCTGIRYEPAFVRNHFGGGRSFLQTEQGKREVVANDKLILVPSLVRGKRVVVVDDSIVRGTMSKRRVRMLKDAGALEVHELVSCPPHMHPCYYGIDFPDQKKLIAATHSREEVRQILGVDSLGYLSLDGLLDAVGLKENVCLACLTGKYPVSPEFGETR